MSLPSPDDDAPTPGSRPSSLGLPAAPPRPRRLIAVGGGRGGVGKSLVAVNLSVYLAQLGRAVVVVDGDAAGANLHALFGLPRPAAPTRHAIEAGAVKAVETSVPGLELVSAVFDGASASALRPGRRSHWSQLLARLEADYVVVDLGSAQAPWALDVFDGADVGLCVTTPEPPAVEATYRFARALFARRLRRAVAKERMQQRLLDRALAELGPAPAPPDLLAAIGRLDGPLAHAGAYELRRSGAYLVVNGTRVRSDVDLGPAMQLLAERFFGFDLQYIGHVEQDDAVWLTVRRRRPLLIDSPTSKSARLLERIARRVAALTASRPDARPAAPPGPPPPPGEPRRFTLYDALGVARGASDEEVRRAHKRQRELYSPGSLAAWSVLDDAAIERERAKLDEAHDTLLDPNRRRAYDLSTFPDAAAPEAAPRGIRPREVSAEMALLQAEIAREIHAATEFSGAFLRRIRESQGIELADVAARTKISLAHLRAIEEESFADLPALVYARGFVRELAKILKLDPAQVDRTYLRRMRQGLAGLGRPTE
jgi:flagellar biosynthesis protein FlhG